MDGNLEKEFEVKRATNGYGDNNLIVIVDPAIPDIYVGGALIVPYADGYKDPIKVLLQTNEKGLPKRANEKFAIISEYIYD